MSTSYQQDDFLSFSGPSVDEGELRRRTALRDILEEQQYMRGGDQDESFFDLDEGTTNHFWQILRASFRLLQNLAKSFFDLFGNASKSFLKLIFIGLIAFIIWTAILNSDGPNIHWYGSDISANLGQFIPSLIKHPSRIFASQDLRDVYHRLDIAESDIKYLKHRSGIDKNALAEIEKVLPDFIALEKDINGEPTLPANLWQAMREKIRADPSLIPTPIRSPREEAPPSGSSKSDARNHEVFNSKELDRYLESNRAKIQSWAGSEFDVLHQARLEKLIKDGKVASKENVVELIKANWRESSQEIRTELKKLAKDLELKVANLGTQTLTTEQVRELANQVVNAQIEAISRTNVNKKAGQSVQRMDHFAKGSHSAVIPRLTTPSYSFPHMDFNFIHRTIASLAGHPIPHPNPADEALTTWDEIGDCWCSPQQNGDGPTLGVLTASKIWPDQVVVEHFPQSGYTNSGRSPGAAPKKMQLLAYLSDKPTFHKVKGQSEQIFTEDSIEDQHDENLGPGWVKLGEWLYDAYGPVTQAFTLQIDLKDFITGDESDLKKDLSATNKFLIRVKSNHGHGHVPYTCLYRVRLHGEVQTDEDGSFRT
ncbi:hypothetical protein DSL72_003243 [Monilinia vaccinii-corymbosi]|uniref:SUN domain-containing protein n=1 Tax=Monilinia vaccinii-corymbosi TaxID=61207 RepID=A0A8A3P1S0_9HELO|nr:hypothetical protein DSL72_003243 [Monilinia vaccinii-corymbosi]